MGFFNFFKKSSEKKQEDKKELTEETVEKKSADISEERKKQISAKLLEGSSELLKKVKSEKNSEDKKNMRFKDLEELLSNTLVLPSVADDHHELALVGAINLADPADPQYLSVCVITGRSLGDECNFPVVIDEAHAGQPFVGDAFAQFECFHIAEVNAALRERLMKSYEKGLILRPYRTDHDRSVVLRLPM